MIKGRSIRLFLADGTPGGIITAEIMNWTGHALFAPRTRLPDLIKRPEASRTGVYFLTGPDPDGGLKPVVYIGETNNVGRRLAQHSKDDTKDFWDRACIITSKDQNLTEAHVRFLESRLITIAGEARRAKLSNGTAPDYANLPEADTADMEFFIEQIRIILPVLGLDFLRETPKLTQVAPDTATPAPTVNATATPQPPATMESPIFEAIGRKHELHAEAREVDGDFIVLAGSLAQGSWIGTPSHNYHGLYQQLVDSGVLVPEGDRHLIFKTDYAFASPSAAAAIVYGRAANGRTAWQIKGTRTTYAEWQAKQVDAAAPSDAATGDDA